VIPRVIHHVWVGDPMPDRLTAYVRTWRDLHPGWDHVMWSSFDWLDNQHLYDNAEAITPHVGQLRADLARYEILHRHGGVYVDCDMEALRPIDDLLGVQCFAGWETDGVWVNNAVLGCVPGHPLMRDLIDAAPASIEQNAGCRPNRMTGPHLLTPLARRHGITVHPSSFFYPYHFTQVGSRSHDYRDAYAAHHWWNRRKRDGVPLPEVTRV
jgi:mannosyltransferase OCH1-like enzyme